MMDRPRQPPLIIAQTADVRIAEFTLGPGEGQPWHYHSEVTDTFYCLEGAIAVEIRDPPSRQILRPGVKGSVPVQAIHRASNAGDGTSRYLLIQGVGRYDFIGAG